jgi:hypothetical protein
LQKGGMRQASGEIDMCWILRCKPGSENGADHKESDKHRSNRRQRIVASEPGKRDGGSCQVARLNPELCHFERSTVESEANNRAQSRNLLSSPGTRAGFEGARLSAVPQVVPFRATVRLEAAPFQSKPDADVFSTRPKKQVPRLRAIIRKRMVALRSE